MTDKELAATIPAAHAALIAKAKECAALEKGGIKNLESQKKFEKLLKEKQVLGEDLRLASEAKERIEALVPKDLREAVLRAEIAVRATRGEQETARRAHKIQDSIYDRLFLAAKGDPAQKETLLAERKKVLDTKKILEAAKKKHEEAIDALKRAVDATK